MRPTSTFLIIQLSNSRGLLAGVLYFIVLLIISLILAGEEGVSVTNYLTTILICLGSGMLGGMVS